MPDEPTSQGNTPELPNSEVPVNPYFQSQQPPVEATPISQPPSQPEPTLPQPQTVPEPQPSQVQADASQAQPQTPPQPQQQFIAEPAVQPTVPPKKSRKKLFIVGGIIVAALALLGGGGALAYTLWYQNPDRVVSESLINALTANTLAATGTISQESKDGGFKVDISGRNDQNDHLTFAAKISFTSKETGTITADGEATYDSNGDIYVKINNAQDLANTIEKQSNGEVSFTPFSKVIQKIDGHWIKIAKDDLGDVSPDAQKTQTCFEDISKAYDTDASFHAAVKNETEALYNKHKFITVTNKLGSRTINGVGSLGYSLTIDQKNAKDFFTGFNDTQLGKKMKACDGTINFSDIVDSIDSSTKDSTTDIQLWASRFGHVMTEFDLTSTDKDGIKSTALINPIFNKNEAVPIPSDAISLAELKSDIEAAYMDYLKSVGFSESVNAGSDSLFN